MTLRLALLAPLVFAPASAACAQQAPRSQRGATLQHVGATEITVRYSRPVARGRELFGGVVRWGRVWCPGADSATTIALSTPVRLEGQAVPAGRYSVWAIPDSTGSWTIILSRAHAIWHTPYPGEGEDQLRLQVTPAQGSHMETLAFYFPVVSQLTATLHLHWGTTIVPLHIEVER